MHGGIFFTVFVEKENNHSRASSLPKKRMVTDASIAFQKYKFDLCDSIPIERFLIESQRVLLLSYIIHHYSRMEGVS